MEEGAQDANASRWDHQGQRCFLTWSRLDFLMNPSEFYLLSKNRAWVGFLTW